MAVLCFARRDIIGESSSAEFTDSAVTASTSYSYSIRACDYHKNCAADSVVGTVTSAPTGAVDPTKTPDTVDGMPGISDQLAARAFVLGVSTITSQELMDLVILHELSHFNGVIGNPDKDWSVEKRLWTDCIR